MELPAMKPGSRRKIFILGILAVVMIGVGSIWGLDIYKFAQHLYFGAYYGVADRHQVKTSRIEAVTFYSESLKTDKEYRVYLPDGYDTGSGRFPVLYLLHGYPGSDRDWLTNTNLQVQLDQLIAQGKLMPLIVVMPDGQGTRFRDSQFVNADLIDQAMEDFVVRDLTKDVDRRYRTVPQRLGRGIAGLSSGGFGAVNLALRHNDEFAFALSFSGYFDGSEKSLKKLLSPDNLKSNTPLSYLPDQHLNPRTSVVLLIGEKDKERFVQSNRQLEAVLAGKGVSSHLIQDPAEGHGWSLWRKKIPEMFGIFGNDYRLLNGIN
ncbi:MAG: alpha/beta hydrolase [Candidatus Saccharibacteria bacterium]